MQPLATLGSSTSAILHLLEDQQFSSIPGICLEAPGANWVWLKGPVYIFGRFALF